VTPTNVPPVIQLNLVQDQGQPWPGGNNLRFTCSFKVVSGSADNDAILTFHSDLAGGDANLDLVQGMVDVGVGAPGDPLRNFYWKEVNLPPTALTTGFFTLPTGGTAITRQVFAAVEPGAVGLTISSQILLKSAAYGIQVSATVNTYILGGTPSPTPTPLPVHANQVVAYPQPANQNICFGYIAPETGAVDIEIYNAAFQVVAHVKDYAPVANTYTQSCVPISKLVPGVYLYKSKVGNHQFPQDKFGVWR
jgi:hypothetical protein